MKNSVVIMASALLLVERGADAACAELLTLVIAIGLLGPHSLNEKTFIFITNPAKNRFLMEPRSAGI